MQLYFSPLDKTRLLHIIADISNLDIDRINVCPPEEFVQVAALNLIEGKVVSPHKHNKRQLIVGALHHTQECWFVFKGKIYVRLFDEENTLVHEQSMKSGQLLVTFNGAHALECSEPNTTLIEFKNGPYLGTDSTPIAV